MRVVSAEVSGLSYFEELGLWAVTVSASLQDGEVQQQISMSLRIQGTKRQTLEDIEGLALVKADAVLRLAADSLAR